MSQTMSFGQFDFFMSMVIHVLEGPADDGDDAGGNDGDILIIMILMRMI